MSSEQEEAGQEPPGPWSHVLPYFLFGVVVSLGGAQVGAMAGIALALQVLIPAAALLWFWSRGAYPELGPAGPEDEGKGNVLGDVALGLGVAVLWVAPFLLFEGLPRPDTAEGFAPTLLGSAALTLAVRLIGFALVTPFMEELFVRSFLLRFLDVFDQRADFRDVPIGRFAWRSFIGTSLWFMATHQTWEWIVALPTGILWNLWLYRRRRIGAVVLSHAVANAAIWAFVLLRAPSNPDLWIFL